MLVGDYMDPKERDTPLNHNRTSDENKSILWTKKGEVVKPQNRTALSEHIASGGVMYFG